MIFKKRDKKKKTTNKKEIQNKKTYVNLSTKKFKEKYFDYYDDIKDYTKGKEDW